ncbi:MFS transporter [Lacrimispora xylanisolvens]|uniref:MFS transporter n=1 Tax=Lacrimispora xylanisolvens TaxID=384636 RepID=UPI0024029A45|nr:MFS transporter [Paenibacillaceae bacterium]
MKESKMSKNQSPLWLVFLLAASCGLIAANLYYAQPLAGLIGNSLSMPRSMTGLIVTMTQLGYVIGLLFIVPLSDMAENRLLTGLGLMTAACGLLISALTHHAGLFLFAACLTGFGSVSAQILVPYSASLVPGKEQGRMVGNVMSGLLLGIMAARPLSSLLAQFTGWRSVFLLSAGIMAVIAAFLVYLLPPRSPRKNQSYPSLIASLFPLFIHTPVLKRRAVYQACLFCSFSLFWTVAPMWLEEHYHLTQTGIALFSLAGVGGAAVSPVAGKLADKGYTKPLTLLAFFTASAAFLLTHGILSPTRISLMVFLAAALLLDMAVSGNLVLSQKAIYELGDQTRGRMNGIFMAVFFTGGALGSFLGGWAYAYASWFGASLIGMAMPLIALLYFLTDNGYNHNYKKEIINEQII